MKKKHSKRILSWLLCLSMVFTMLPGAAFAAEQGVHHAARRSFRR